MRCGSTGFKLLPGGYVSCFECNKKYSYVSGFNSWVPHAMSAEEFLIKIEGKKWDPVEQKFIDSVKTKDDLDTPTTQK
jgi:hypothetical protein